QWTVNYLNWRPLAGSNGEDGSDSILVALWYVVPVAVVGGGFGLLSGALRWGPGRSRPTGGQLVTGPFVGLGRLGARRLCLANLLAGSLGGFGLYLILNEFVWPCWYRPRLLACCTPPMLLALLGLVGYVQVAAAGRVFDEQEREWRSRLGGNLLLFGL